MKTKKVLFSLVMAIILLAQCAVFPALAANTTPDLPRYNNTLTVSCKASVSSAGVITIKNKFTGISGVTTGATIETYIEKRVLGLFWSRVDIGQPNNTWVDAVSGTSYSGSHTFQLASSGTYRVTASFTIRGSGGAADEITKTVTTTY